MRPKIHQLTISQSRDVILPENESHLYRSMKISQSQSRHDYLEKSQHVKEQSLLKSQLQLAQSQNDLLLSQMADKTSHSYVSQLQYQNSTLKNQVKELQQKLAQVNMNQQLSNQQNMQAVKLELKMFKFDIQSSLLKLKGIKKLNIDHLQEQIANFFSIMEKRQQDQIREQQSAQYQQEQQKKQLIIQDQQQQIMKLEEQNKKIILQGQKYQQQINIYTQQSENMIRAKSSNEAKIQQLYNQYNFFAMQLVQLRQNISDLRQSIVNFPNLANDLPLGQIERKFKEYRILMLADWQKSQLIVENLKSRLIQQQDEFKQLKIQNQQDNELLQQRHDSQLRLLGHELDLQKAQASTYQQQLEQSIQERSMLYESVQQLKQTLTLLEQERINAKQQLQSFEQQSTLLTEQLRQSRAKELDNATQLSAVHSKVGAFAQCASQCKQMLQREAREISRIVAGVHCLRPGSQLFGQIEQQINKLLFAANMAASKRQLIEQEVGLLKSDNAIKVQQLCDQYNCKIEQMQARYEALEQQQSAAEAQQNAELSRIAAQVSQRNSQLLERNESLERQVLDLQGELGRMQKAEADARQQAEELREKCENAAFAHSNERRELAEWKNRAALDVAPLKAAVAALRGLALCKPPQFQPLEDALGRLQAAWEAQAASRARQAQAAADASALRLEEKEAQLRELRMQHSGAQSELWAAQRESESRAKLLRAQLLGQESECAQARAENQELEAAMREQKLRVDKAQIEQQQLLAQIQQHEASAEQRQRQLEALSGAYQEQLAISQKASADANSLRQRLAAINAQMPQLRGDVQKLRAVCSHTTDLPLACDRLQRTFASIQQSQAEKQSNLVQQSTMIKSEQEAVASKFESQLADCKRENSMLQQELARAMQQQRAHVEEFAKLQRELENKSNQSLELQKSLQLKSQQFEQVQSEFQLWKDRTESNIKLQNAQIQQLSSRLLRIE